MSDNLQLILRAVQEFDISVSRAAELIEIDQKGEFNYDLLPYGAGTQAIFGFDEVPVQKYKELLAERDSLVRAIKITNKNLFDTQEAAKIITKQAIVAETERDALASTERRLRRMLCRQRHGISAYMDDGEASFGGDEFQRPTDYLRESLDSIEQGWIEAGLKQAALAQPQPQPQPDGWIPWAATATSRCPVGQDTWVAVRLANGQEIKEGKPHQAGQFFWGALPAGSIVAYRVVK